MNFNEIGFSDTLLKNITNAKYNQLTEIQERTIPLILEGKDIVGIAQTGTGKTAAFTLTIIEKLINEDNEPKKIKVLVLSPTRELAIQTRDCFKMFSENLNIKSTAVLGGVNQNAQIRIIKNGIDVLVATPGRLLDLLKQKRFKLDSCSTLVLDEADTMLDMGFIDDVKKIIKYLPEVRQTLLFSATMAEEIEEITKKFMNDPIMIKTVTEQVPIKINQKLYYVDKKNKLNLLFDLLNTKEHASTLIFTKMKSGADELEKEFKKYDIKVSVIHGDKRQSNRARALREFKEGKTNILIATDIASRGIDIHGLKQVINYDIPEYAQDYVHRIGRTGRAGETGTSITFCTSRDMSNLASIQKLTNTKMEVVEHKYPMEETADKKNNRHDKHSKGKFWDKKNNHQDHNEITQNEEHKKYNHNNNAEFKGKDYGKNKRYEQNNQESNQEKTFEFKRNDHKSHGNFNNKNKKYNHRSNNNYKKNNNQKNYR